MINLQGLDLNLLRTLNVLLSEITSPARRSASTCRSHRSACSWQGYGRFSPTRCCCRGRAVCSPPPAPMNYAGPLRDALLALELAVAPVQPFDPATAAQTWRVAATDYMASAILLPVLNTLRIASPASRLALFELQPARLVQQADRDEVDLFFHTRDGAPPGLHQRLLVPRTLRAGGQGRASGAAVAIKLAQFCQLEQVIVSPDGGGFSAATDSALANLGLAAAGCPFRATFPVYAGDAAQ
ncbi:transcriptional regulator [Klebsiella michiganensis]|nr:transcriptional regulator [Klebsiella michiganensis]